jgi:hypothetical protein
MVSGPGWDKQNGSDLLLQGHPDWLLDPLFEAGKTE